jgi:hypothetical protein
MTNLALKPAADACVIAQPARLLSPDFWRSFAPSLHIEDHAVCTGISPVEITPDQRRAIAELLRVEGYFQGSVDWGLDLATLATTIRGLVAANIPAVFAFLYDEYWLPFAKLHRLYSEILGVAYQMLPDFWVWNIDPQRGESGWKPHRDRGRNALWPDGSPKSLTTWIPLSPATTLNGCMYIVPALLDPTYATADEDRWTFDYASIRALPANPGDFFIWNQAVLHWGSTSSPRAPESRVSMAFEFQSTEAPPFNLPLLPPLSSFPFESRFKLIAKQVLQYRHMYEVDPVIERMALELLA